MTQTALEVQGWGEQGWGKQGWGEQGWGKQGWGEQGWGKQGWGEQGWGKPSPYYTRIGWPLSSIALEAALIRVDSVHVHCRVRYIMLGYWLAVRSASACTCRNLS